MESKKQAARRPKPPLPSAASGSWASVSSSVRAWACSAAAAGPVRFKRIQGVGQRTPHQKFHRQVIDPLGLGLRVCGLRGHPAAGELLAGDQGQGLHFVVGIGLAGQHGQILGQSGF